MEPVSENESESAANLFVCDELSHLTNLLRAQLNCLSLKEKELINREEKLQDREERLRDREEELELRGNQTEEREKKLGELSLLAANTHSTISAYVEEQISKATSASQAVIDDLKSSLSSTEGQLERLKHSYEESRCSNQRLRSQLNSLSSAKTQLEREVKQLQARIASLQAARTAQQPPLSSNKQHSTADSPCRDGRPSRPTVKKKKLSMEHKDALLSELVDWLTEALSDVSCFSSVCHFHSSHSRLVLPLLSKVLPEAPPSHHLPLLRIILLSLRFLEEKSPLMSSLRAVGRYILSPQQSNSSTQQLFLQSSDASVRMLSCLCLLSTLNEEDALVTALQCLLQDLTMIECQKLFLDYTGVSILTELIKPSTKRVTQMAVTILTMLSLNFVEHCASEHCIETVANLLKHSSQISNDTMNNLTIFLQRLSEHRMCWKWFKSYGLVSSLEKMRERAAVSADQDSQFRLRNILSILKNKPHSNH